MFNWRGRVRVCQLLLTKLKTTFVFLIVGRVRVCQLLLTKLEATLFHVTKSLCFVLCMFFFVLVCAIFFVSGVIIFVLQTTTKNESRNTLSRESGTCSIQFVKFFIKSYSIKTCSKGLWRDKIKTFDNNTEVKAQRIM